MNSEDSARKTLPSYSPNSASRPLWPKRPARPKPAISDHELLRLIGFGSYGDVWLGRNIMGIYRAVKVVYRDTFDSDKPYEREFEGIKRFEPVSRSHDSQVAILHVGRNDEAAYFYYVMELADDAAGSGGQPSEDPDFDPEAYVPKTLHALSPDRRRLPTEECLECALELTTALQHLHAHGLVHRDIKPSNIIVVNGRPKLADIGLVAQSDATLSFVGTEGFVPPEGPGQPQADLFSLGKTLYEIATGKDRAHFPEPPTMIGNESDHGLFMEFNEILLKACTRDVASRYQTAAEMHEDLLLLKAGKSLRRARILESRLASVRRIAIGFVLVSGLAVTAYFHQQRQTREAERLASENRELAVKEAEQRKAAEAAVSRQELQKIDQLLETGQSSQGLARLAHRVRVNPEDAFATRRLLSALTYRDFALPLAELYHEAVIMDGEISPDGKRLVTATSEGEVVFWNLETAEEIGRDQAGDFNFSNFALSFTRYTPGSYIIPTWNVNIDPSSTRVVAPGGRACAVRIWDITGEPSLSLEIKDPGMNEFSHAEFSPDGRQVAAMALSGSAFVWDAKTGKHLASMVPDQDLQGTIVACRFTPDGRRLITANCAFGNPANRGLFAWDSVTGELLNRNEDRGYVMGATRLWREPIALDPSGPRVVYPRAGGPAFLKIWNHQSDEVISGPQPHDFPIGCVAFSPSGGVVASGGNDQTVRLWEVGETLRLRHLLRHHGMLTTVAFSPSGELMASGSEHGVLQLWNPLSGRHVGEPIQQGASVRHVEFAPDGERLVSYDDHSAWVWDISPGAARPVLIASDSHGDHPPYITAVEYSPDGNYLLTTPIERVGVNRYESFISTLLSRPIYARVWTPGSGEPVSPEIRCSGGQVTMVEDDEGWRVLSNNTVTYWDPRTGIQKGKPISVPGVRGGILAISPNGRWALKSDYNTQAVVWDIERGEELAHSREQGPIIAGAFDPDSERLFTVTARGQGRILRLDSGETIASVADLRIQRHKTHARWSPDGIKISFGAGSIARLYDAATGKPASDWLIHDDALLDTCFSRDSRHFLTASADQTAKVWEVATGRQVTPNLRHGWVIYGASLSANGGEVATASWDKTARVWAREGGLPLTDPLPHPGWVVAVGFHPSGQWLATGCTDGAARVWELPRASGPVPEWLPELAEALAGYQVTESDSLELVEGRKRLLALRKRLEREPEGQDDDYARWGRWFFADRARRAVSPGAETDMRTYRRRLALLDTIKLHSQHETLLRLSGMEPRYLARLGHKLVAYESREWIPDLARADWLTRLAVKKAPKLAMAWWARAEVLQATGDKEQASQAVEQALNLDPREPNAWLVKALLLHDAKPESEAYEAFKRAAQLAQEMAEAPPPAGDRYLDPLLRMIASIDFSDVTTLNRWIYYSQGHVSTDRFRLITDWLTAWALDQAPEHLKAPWLTARANFLAQSGWSKSVITDQPRHVIARAGESFELRVTTQANEPLQFQWLHNDELLASTDQSVLIITNFRPADAGAYRVVAQGRRPFSRHLELSKNIIVRIRDDDWVYGALKREIWRNIPGTKLAELTSDLRFPNDPDEVDWLGTAEFQTAGQAMYGARTSGWLIPPVTGEYRFFFLSDDEGILRLSPDAAPEKAAQIAHLGWNQPRKWESEVSLPIRLEAGQPRYLEALIKQGGGDTYFGIAWQMPGEPPSTNGAKPIPGRYFAQPSAEGDLSSAPAKPAVE